MRSMEIKHEEQIKELREEMKTEREEMKKELEEMKKELEAANKDRGYGKVHVAAGYSAWAIVKNLAPNVNLSYCMDLWTLGSKLQKNYCWTFSQ